MTCPRHYGSAWIMLGPVEGTYDSGPDFSRLTAIERVLCGALIRRQWTHDPRRTRELQQYGPVGFVQLCAARAWGAYMVGCGVVAVPLAIAGVSTVPGALYGLLLVAAACSIGRSISAGRAGRLWRRDKGRETTRSVPMQVALARRSPARDHSWAVIPGRPGRRRP